jgi:hypothetical protein
MDTTSPKPEPIDHSMSDIVMQDVDHPEITDNTSLCDDDSDAASESATLDYEQEPYEEFKPKVISVALQKLHRDVSEIEVEQMKGGSFNRVANITISPKAKKFSFSWFKSHCFGGARRSKSTASKHIIRIPRTQY